MRIEDKECISCGICTETCKHGAIKTISTSGYARFEIDGNICIECGECLSACMNEAIYEM